MYWQLHFHGNFLLINHDITDIKHNGQIITQIYHAAMFSGIGNQCDHVGIFKFFKQTGHRIFRLFPTSGKFLITEQGISSLIAKIYYRIGIRTLHRWIIIGKGSIIFWSVFDLVLDNLIFFVQ